MSVYVISPVNEKGEIINKKSAWNTEDKIRYFELITRYGSVVVDRDTYQRETELFKRKRNIVLLNDNGISSYKGNKIDSLEELVLFDDRDEELYVTGKREFCIEALKYAKKIYLSYMKGDIETTEKFPEFDEYDYYETVFPSRDNTKNCCYVRKRKML